MALNSPTKVKIWSLLVPQHPRLVAAHHRQLHSISGGYSNIDHLIALAMDGTDDVVSAPSSFLFNPIGYDDNRLYSSINDYQSSLRIGTLYLSPNSPIRSVPLGNVLPR